MNDMTYEDFKLEVTMNIKDFLPESFAGSKVELREINKNNTTLDGLIIRDENENIAPTIYLNSFYQDVQNGKPFEAVMTDIAAIRNENQLPLEPSQLPVYSFEQAKDMIQPRVYGIENNDTLLAERPHTEMDGIAVTYQIMLKEDEQGAMSIPITNGLLDKWNVDVSTIHEQALSNLDTNVEKSFRSMGEVMQELMADQMMRDTGCSREEAMDMASDFAAGPDNMYVLSNESKNFGAAALLDEKTMSEISDKVGEFYILPSSVHEVLIVPKNEDMDLGFLENMVQEVNQTEVKPEDKLSDHVYTYDNETKEIYRADHEQEHQLAKEAKQERNPKAHDKEEKSERPSLKERLEEKKSEIKAAEKTVKDPVKKKEQSL